MTIWHCPRCAREFRVDDGVIAHFHRCTERYDGNQQPRPRRLPMDREERGKFFHALLNAVSAEKVWRDAS